MTTRLTNKEFESRLTNLTRVGEPTIMGTPFAILTIFDFSGKPFYGEFNKTEFRLTRNKVLPVPTGYIIKGSYNESDNRTILSYEIRPILFSYYWIRIAPMIFFVFFNGVLLFNLKTFHLDIILTINVFLFLMAYLGISVDKFQKKRIEKRFQEEFEVEY